MIPEGGREEEGREGRPDLWEGLPRRCCCSCCCCRSTTRDGEKEIRLSDLEGARRGGGRESGGILVGETHHRIVVVILVPLGRREGRGEEGRKRVS